MLAVRIQGGLGNQIFQYLLALELKEQFPEADVAIDLNSYNRFRPHNGYELEKWVERDPGSGSLRDGSISVSQESSPISAAGARWQE